ncbi:unnamed protein product, partial [Prorocentrum cordatum]
VLLNVGGWMLDNARSESAARLALQLDDYGRPPESVEMMIGNMQPPVSGVRGSASRDWNVVFAPGELGLVAQTGQVAAAPVQTAFKQGSGRRPGVVEPKTPLFRNLTFAQCERDFRAAATAFNY